ncbi:MAG TPA: hypothetical protein VKY90_11095, partial [Candidatus Dormibacteraeota bacterium]|nr:hypothetical protein [Candidatus Dormibacteraeota bacterium]
MSPAAIRLDQRGESGDGVAAGQTTQATVSLSPLAKEGQVKPSARTRRMVFQKVAPGRRRW